MAAEDQDFVVLGENDIQDFNPEGLLPLPEEKILLIRGWLAPTDYSSISSEWGKHQTSHLVGTGSWILNTDQYRKWHASDEGGLWIKAVAGAGKSVMAATIVSKLAAEEKVPVLYFFFRHIISANQTPKSLIRDFLSQLLQYSPKLQNDLFKLIHDKGRSLDSVSSDELWGTLVSILSQLPRVYCIVDALDEMDVGHEDFFGNLVALTQKSPTSIKVLMTSRPMPHIERCFRNVEVMQLVLQPQLINPDISAYVKHRLDGTKLSLKTCSKIHDTLCMKADGHFLYARLMMDNLLDTAEDAISDERRLLKALGELPSPMADMYTQMLFEHSQRSQTPQALQVKILQWVTRAERPLRLLELSSLVDAKTLMPRVPKDAKSIVREACGPLLEIFEDETVHPIHHSFTEYLYDRSRLDIGLEPLKFPVLNDKRAQRALLVTCLERLASGWHTQRPIPELASGSVHNRIDSGTLDEKNLTKMKYPYLDYAARNWNCHLIKSGATDGDVLAALHKILVDDPDLLRALLKWDGTVRRLPSHALKPRENFDTWSPLHAAADKGITLLVESLLRERCEIDELNQAGRTPLALAARNGHHDVVQMLLQNGAKSDEADTCGLTPLHHAARANHWQVVKLLLEAGVDPYTPKTKEDPGRSCGNAPRTRGETAVQYACSFGHVQTMKVIVSFLEGEKLQQALYWALRFGRSEIAVDLLQRPGIDVNYYFNNHTLLYLASRARDLKAMRLLLDKGADPHLLSSDFIEHGRTFTRRYGRCASPLHIFAERHNREDSSYMDEISTPMMIKGFAMLLDAGIDPNIPNARGFTILHTMLGTGSPSASASSNDESFLRPTLEFLHGRGLSLESPTNDGCNALHLAHNVTTDVLDMLIDHGVDVNAARSSDGQTPLMTAFSRSNTAVVRHFLKRGANARCTDHNGNTVLHVPLRLLYTDIELIRDLIKAGVDVNSRNKDGNTILHVAEFRAELADLFIQHGFDLECKNKLGQTLLFQSVASFPTISSYRNLIEFGSDPLTRDNQGRTILHALVLRLQDMGVKTSDVFRYLVGKGVDPQSTDAQNNNLWHVVASMRAEYLQTEQHTVMMKLLMDYGVSPIARNVTGQTPFHIACSVPQSQYPYGPIEFLFDHAEVNVNVPDYDQVRPLHLTASFNCQLTCLLLERDADCTAVTIEGQTPLMIACRTRQCNIVCTLLDHCRRKSLLHLIDQIDRTGQTALHHACRSGRPEIVALLLEAGANPNSKDRQDATPLHACATSLDEDASWQKSTQPPSNGASRTSGASYVLSTDSSRPFCENTRENRHQPIDCPVRIRETVRLLVEYGAETTFLTTGEVPNPLGPPVQSYIDINQHLILDNPLSFAISRGCGPMVSELLLIQGRLSQMEPTNIGVTAIEEGDGSSTPKQSSIARRALQDKMNTFHNRVKLLKMQYMPDVIADSVKVGKPNFLLVKEILKDDDEPGVRMIAELGACFSRLESRDENVLALLASWGFADLLCDFSEDVAHVTALWRRDLAAQSPNWLKSRLHSILYTALDRAIPNMAVVKVVVSKFQHDVNEMFANGAFEPVMHSYAHMLARPSHWWQTDALIYLLEHGADVNLLSSDGETPLISALRPPFTALDGYQTYRYDPLRVRAVETLLSRGANPNAIDKDGLTCLNIAARQPRCIRLLLEYGADPTGGTRSFLIDAVKAQDIETIKTIIAFGADLNCTSQVADQTEDRSLSSRLQRKALAKSPLLDDMQERSGTGSLEDLSAHAYPIHVAASKFFNSSNKIDKAREIIHLLLEGGANPFLRYKDGSSIFHCLARHGGIIEPFLSLSSFDIELRDGKGRTFLLAACAPQRNRRAERRWTSVKNDAIPTLIKYGASIDAVDDEGRNALHYLIDTGPKDDFDVEGHGNALRPFLSTLLFRTDSRGRTPYHYAVPRCNIGLIKLLLDNGSDPTTPDPIDRSTILHHLAPKLVGKDLFLPPGDGNSIPPQSTSVEKPENLVGKGNNVRRRQVGALSHEMTSEQFLEAEQRSPHRLFASLLTRGLSVNDKDTSGETPLFKLARTGALAAYWIDEEDAHVNAGLLHSALQVLEESGTDFKARNHSAESVLHILARQTAYPSRYRDNGLDTAAQARERDLRASFMWLVSQGVDVTWEDNEQRTCLDVAAVSGATWLTKLYERE